MVIRRDVLVPQRRATRTMAQDAFQASHVCRNVEHTARANTCAVFRISLACLS